MAYQESVAVRNASLDAKFVAIGASPLLKFFTGTQPASCATADSGTMLASMTLPSSPMAAATGGTKSMAGTWQDASADGSGTLGYWRMYDNAGTTCHLQGSVTATGGGGQITVASTTITAAQPFSILTFVLTAGNA